MSFVASTLNKIDDNVKNYDPVSWELFGKSVSDYRHSTEAQATTPVTIDPNAVIAAQDAATQSAAANLARGRTSTILNGEAGLANTGTTSKVLLGQ